MDHSCFHLISFLSFTLSSFAFILGISWLRIHWIGITHHSQTSNEIIQDKLITTNKYSSVDKIIKLEMTQVIKILAFNLEK